MGTQKQPQKGRIPGPKPDRMKIDGDWKEAAKKALEKKRPPEGWPNPEEMQAKEKGQAE